MEWRKKARGEDKMRRGNGKGPQIIQTQSSTMYTVHCTLYSRK